VARMVADYSFERAAGHGPIAGVDEVGRGPLAGPVTAAAVILNPANIPAGLADSKTLSAARREVLFSAIMASAQVSIAHASVQEIDDLNILRASHLAMTRAINGLPRPPAHVLIDGNLIPRGLSLPAASIIAKVTRDRLMVDLAQHYPAYGWDKNAGYPTKLHLDALQNLGVTPWHRQSFKPVHNILYQDNSITL
jgi:ribonuclease HII